MQSKDKDVVEIVVKITIDLWAQAWALEGVYKFFEAIVLSQFVGFCFIKFASFSSKEDLKLGSATTKATDQVANLCCKVNRFPCLQMRAALTALTRLSGASLMCFSRGV